jgi:hypothetical protein
MFCAAIVLAWSCWALAAEAAEGPDDARSASELREWTTRVIPIQRDLRLAAESASGDTQFELYRTYDLAAGTWLQIDLVRAVLGAAIAAQGSDAQRLRTDLRDHARYALWEVDQNIADLDARLGDDRPSPYLRLFEALRESLVATRMTLIRLAADPCTTQPSPGRH